MRIVINTHLFHWYKRAGGSGWWLVGNYGEVYGIKLCRCGRTKVINCPYRPTVVENNAKVSATIEKLNSMD